MQLTAQQLTEPSRFDLESLISLDVDLDYQSSTYKMQFHVQNFCNIAALDKTIWMNTKKYLNKEEFRNMQWVRATVHGLRNQQCESASHLYLMEIWKKIYTCSAYSKEQM